MRRAESRTCPPPRGTRAYYLETEARKKSEEDELRRRAEMKFRAVAEEIGRVQAREDARSGPLQNRNDWRKTPLPVVGKARAARSPGPEPGGRRSAKTRRIKRRFARKRRRRKARRKRVDRPRKRKLDAVRKRKKSSLELTSMLAARRKEQRRADEQRAARLRKQLA